MTDPDSKHSPERFDSDPEGPSKETASSPEAESAADHQDAQDAVTGFAREDEVDESGTDSLRDLLRGAAAQDNPPMPDVLGGVQRKIRVRSRGKYFADAWSTSRQPPISTYLVTSLVMLAIAAFVYVVLSPLSGEPVKVEPPAPINVVPPSPY